MYVSFYKILGGIAGSVLAGPADVIAEARTWQRRRGSNLVHLYPLVLSAQKGLLPHGAPVLGMGDWEEISGCFLEYRRGDTDTSTPFHFHITVEVSAIQGVGPISS